jgi:hypothetical protein
MASIADSVFGPSPEELEYAERQRQEELARKEYRDRLALAGEGLGMYQGLARAGVRTGERLRTLRLFAEDKPSPAMEKASAIREIIGSMSSEDLSNPDTLMKVSSELANRGYANEALQVADRAREISRQSQLDELTKAQKELAIQQKQQAIAKKALGKPLSDKLLGSTEEKAKALNETEWLSSNFDDDYTGFLANPLGDASISIAKLSPLASEKDKTKAAWWMKYEERKNAIRKALFGAAFTETEAKAFDRITITPWMTPDAVRSVLASQAEAARSAYVKNIMLLKRQGKDISGLVEMAPSLGIDSDEMLSLLESGEVKHLLLDPTEADLLIKPKKEGKPKIEEKDLRPEVIGSDEWSIDRVVK